MVASALADCFGTYRLQQQQQPTSRQRHALRWLTVVILILLTSWFVVQFRRGGIGALLDVLPYALIGPVAGVIQEVIGRRLGPLTRLGPDGITVGTGLTGGRRSVRWEQVASLDVPQRFETHHVAVLANGDRVELPGLSAGVIERLRAELGATPIRATAPPPRPSAAGIDGNWDGPFTHPA